jgi:preprotein translocase subunit SecG
MLSGLLITIDILVCIALIAVVLLQRSEGGAFGMGGGPTGLITARGAGDLLTRTTWVLFAVFLGLSLGLTLLGAHDRATSSMLDKLKLQTANPAAIGRPAGTNATAPLTAPPPAGAPVNPLSGSAFLPPPPAPVQQAPLAAPTPQPIVTAAPTARPKPSHAAKPSAVPTLAAPTAAAPPPPVLEAPPPTPAPTSGSGSTAPASGAP